ncbi:MAG: 23S rRNA (uracil(1939)-C(5))-methyltransferase RlmD [Eubacteriales bacterium]|nr:23S rRNA (uracil(1939)-C(5))-methyltransferase RlmD [Eubacteriales bacterium]
MNEKSSLITDINQQGQGIGRLDGQVIFVDGAIPGDCVVVEIIEQHKQYAVARLVSTVSPSPDRIEPFCELFNRCGGCALQAMNYPAQLIHKRHQVVNLLTRIGKLADANDLVLPTLGMAQPFGYRCKVQFPVRGTSSNPQIGFYERRSHQVVDGATCAVGHPLSDVIRDVVRTYCVRTGFAPYEEKQKQGDFKHLVIRIGRESGQIMVILVTQSNTPPPKLDFLIQQLQQAITEASTSSQTFEFTTLVQNVQPVPNNVILGRENHVLFGPGFIEDRLQDLRFRISPLSFFQVNPEQAHVLYQAAVSLADPRAGDQVLDLYCGTGTITLALAKQAPQATIIGIESVAAAIIDAQFNAAQNQVKNVRFESALAEKWMIDAVESGAIAPRIAVIDPPRRGCDEALLAALMMVPLKRLVYVSCNPATLARDIALLSPVYQVQAVQPVDMFPWTDSIECVCLLTHM